MSETYALSPIARKAPFGLMGELADDGVRVQCHVCGRWFGHLGNHVARTHELECDEYRRAFGLNATTGLIGPRLKEMRQEVMKRPEILERIKGGFKERGRPRPQPRAEETRRRRMLESNDIGYCLGCGREMWTPKTTRNLTKLRTLTCGDARCVVAIRPLVYDDEWRGHVSDARYQGRTAPSAICKVCGERFTQQPLGRNHWAVRKTCSRDCLIEGRRKKWVQA